MKKTIKLKFTDMYKDDQDYFIDLLKDKYDVFLSDDPDYVIYSVFGNDHLRYNCIRIFYTVECLTPDFNECDYAWGYDRLSFGDRYIRIPDYLTLSWKKSYQELLKPRRKVTLEEWKNRKFCSFVVSNCFGDDHRKEMFDLVSTYKKVDSGGRYLNNIGGAVKDKNSFLKNYKFNIAFENASSKGYTTEKIVDAFNAYTIPIYYGDPDIVLDFNEKAFINCTNNHFDEALKRINEIDQNDQLALDMINSDPLAVRKDTDLDLRFLSYIFDQDYNDAHRRPISMYTKRDAEAKLRHEWYESHIYKYWKKGKNTFQRIKNGTFLTNMKTK